MHRKAVAYCLMLILLALAAWAITVLRRRAWRRSDRKRLVDEQRAYRQRMRDKRG